MEMIYYTLAALVLYGVSDYILTSIEIKLQKRLPNRSLVFFVIISVLALLSFSVIRMLYETPEQNTTVESSPAQPTTSVNTPEPIVQPQALPEESPADNLSPAESSQSESSPSQNTEPPSI